MTMAVPVQEFQIGQRVCCDGRPPFVIMAVSFDGDRFYYGEDVVLDTWHRSSELTLCSERPPYVPSERLVMGRELGHRFNGQFPDHYRCETDDELAARHAIERAEYEQQDATNAVIYNASGQPIGITGRTGQPGPGAA